MILRISVLGGVAAGITSILYFLGVIAGANPFVSLIVSGAACVAAVKWLALPLPEAGAKPPTKWLRIVFSVVLLAAMAAFVGIAMKEPHGDWDAWSIWNLHARFLARGGDHWTAMFSKDLAWSHPNYPLLLPAFIAQLWSVTGAQSRFVPVMIAFLFTFLTVGALFGAVRRLRGWDQALIAGVFLLGGAELTAQGITQYADIPLAFYIVSALALLFFEDVKCTVLAGALTGFAAWTKNEGLLFLIALLLARCIARLRFRESAKLPREIGWIAAGAVPALATLALFKIKYAPADDLLLSHKAGELMARATDFGRYITVIEAFVEALFRAGGFLVPGIIVLGVYAWLVGFKPDAKQRVGLATVIIAVAIMLLGDFAVYVLFPNDVNWQLGTSMPRVFFQVWPAALLAFFTAVSTVDLAAAPPKQKESRKELKRAAAARRH
jgi:hypothetical protein